MQQPPQMLPMMHSFPPTNITTEQIQKYLDENKKLILAILDNQNLGKLAECAQKPLEYPSENISYKYEGDAGQWYQAQLQKNLMYLAAIADAQPQAPAMPPQMAPHPAMQQGGYYMQHPQATAMAQQPGFFPSKMPLQFGNPHQMQDSHQQLHQQGIQGQMGMRPIGSNNGLHPSQSHHLEASLVGQSAGQSDVRGGNKRDSVEVGVASTDGAGGSGAGQGRGEGEEPK